MTHISPAANLSWAVYATLFECFLLTHLWRYDRFKCLKWTSSNQPGAFKRLMTYTYLSTVPLFMVYAVAMARIKYAEGYVSVREFGVVPKPFQLWSSTSRSWITPLYFVFSVAWSLEIVTHLEEFNFWLFLLNQGPVPRAWFSSIEFKLWFGGSIMALIALPLTVAFTKGDPLRCEAWIFFAGSLGSTLVTTLFLYVLFKFPTFLRKIASDGATPPIIERLTAFHQLNITRIVFRFAFTLPLLILASDGIRPGHKHPLNESEFWTDLFIMFSGLAVIISSGMTLLLFFPIQSGNNVPQEQQQPPHDQGKASYSDHRDGITSMGEDPFARSSHHSPPREPSRDSDTTVRDDSEEQENDENPFSSSPSRMENPITPPPSGSGSKQLGHGDEIEMGRYEEHRQSETRRRQVNTIGAAGVGSMENMNMMEAGLRRPSLVLHPYISNFTSPIDFDSQSSPKEVEHPHPHAV